MKKLLIGISVLAVIGVIAAATALYAAPSQQAPTVSAWAYNLANITPLENGHYQVSYNVLLSTFPASEIQVFVDIDPVTDGPLAIRTKTSDAIQALCTQQGFDCPKLRMVLPEWQKGL